MRSEILREKEKAAGGVLKPTHIKRWKQAVKVFEWIVFLFVLVALVITLFGVYTTKSQGETPVIFGVYMLYSVESGSMEPTLTVGSVIVCKKTEHPDNLKTDQIVTFRTLSGAVVTHRIIDISNDENRNITYRTKGDNPINSPDEELLTPDRVIGVFAAKIPFT
jgi:signal peptidase